MKFVIGHEHLDTAQLVPLPVDARLHSAYATPDGKRYFVIGMGYIFEAYEREQQWYGLKLQTTPSKQAALAAAR